MLSKPETFREYRIVMNDKMLNFKLGSELPEDTSFMGPTNFEFHNLGFNK